MEYMHTRGGLWWLVLLVQFIYVYSAFTYVDNSTPQSLFHYLDTTHYPPLNSVYGPPSFNGSIGVEIDEGFIYVVTASGVNQYDAESYLFVKHITSDYPTQQYVVYTSPTYIYSLVLTNTSGKVDLRINAQSAASTTSHEFAGIGSSNVKITVDTDYSNILFYYPAIGFFKMPLTALTLSQYQQFANTDDDTDSSFPFLYDNLYNLMIFGGKTDDGYIVYGMPTTKNASSSIIYAVNTTSDLMIYAGNGVLYGLQRNESDINGWLWSCNISDCTPEYMFDVPVPAMAPFKYDYLYSDRLYYKTSDRNATVSLYNNTLQSIASPRRIAAYCSISNDNYWVTDTGLFESYSRYSHTHQAYAYVKINAQNSYWNSDVSHFSMACDSNNAVVYLLAHGLFRSRRLSSGKYSKFYSINSTNVLSPSAMHVSYSSSKIYVFDRSDFNVKSAVLPYEATGNATFASLEFKQYATFDSLARVPHRLAFDDSHDVLYAITKNGIYSNNASSSAMALEKSFSAPYRPYAIVAQATGIFFLAGDLHCAPTNTCLSVQKCDLQADNTCALTKVADIPDPYNNEPRNASIVLIKDGPSMNFSIVLKINNDTPLLKIVVLTGDVSVFTTTAFGPGSISATANTVLVSSNSSLDILELNAAGDVINTYSPPFIDPAMIFSHDGADDFYYVTAQRNVWQCTSLPPTNCSNFFSTSGYSNDTIPTSLFATADLIYYTTKDGSLRGSNSFYISPFELKMSPTSYLAAYGGKIFVANSTFPSISISQFGSTSQIYVPYRNVTGFIASYNMLYWTSAGTASILSMNVNKGVVNSIANTNRTATSELVGLDYDRDYYSYNPNSSSHEDFNGILIFLVILVVIAILVAASLTLALIIHGLKKLVNRQSPHSNARAVPPAIPLATFSVSQAPDHPASPSPLLVGWESHAKAYEVPVFSPLDGNDSNNNNNNPYPTTAGNDQHPAEALLCPICIDSRKDAVLSCGHVLCRNCAVQMKVCPFCKLPITEIRRIFL